LELLEPDFIYFNADWNIDLKMPKYCPETIKVLI